MRKTIPDAANSPNSANSPLLYEEEGELSLHFNFPTIQSRMLKAEPEKLLLDYTQTMMGFLLFQPTPQRMAMIGLGGGSLAKYCRRTLPTVDFTAIELSAEVIALREQFRIPADGPLFRIVCADGADYVRSATTPVDVLLVDGFDAGGQPERLCSAAFYDACYAQLSEGGILVVNLCADDAGYDSYVRRIADAFAEKFLIVEAHEGENKIVFASKGISFPPAFGVLVERLRMLEAAHPVGLDRTAQRILHYTQMRGQSRSGRQKSRRRGTY
jgi:spermidine synthase